MADTEDVKPDVSAEKSDVQSDEAARDEEDVNPSTKTDTFTEDWKNYIGEVAGDHETGAATMEATSAALSGDGVKQELNDSYEKSGGAEAGDDGAKKEEAEEKPDFVIRVRGLPWSTKEKDVREFFNTCENIITIHFTYSREGRPTGEAYIELGSSEDVDRALLKNRELLGQRYIEVFVSKKDEMEFVLKRSGRRIGQTGSGRSGSFDSGTSEGAAATADPETVVRLRGLPFGCTKEDIVTFFDGLEIVADGIIFSAQHQSSHYGPQTGRRSKPGEAYVRFVDKETTERALDRHMNKIGHRYIEVFRSTVDEMERMGNPSGRMLGAYGRSGSRPGPYSSPGGPGGPVPLCSIPFPEFGGSSGGRNQGWQEGSRYGRGGGRNRNAQGGYDPYYSGYYQQGGDGSYYDPSGMYYGGDGMEGAYGTRRYVVHMRGLPYKATTNDIMEFFKPLQLVNVQILYDERTGRPSGEADVELCSHDDAMEAMTKDRHNMGGRYIELFFNSRPGPPAGVPASALRQGAGAYGTAPYPQNGSEAGVMGMMPVATTGATVGVGGVTYAQPLVQYPGFGAYGYAMDASGMMPAAQPPPPPPSSASDPTGKGASSYY